MNISSNKKILITGGGGQLAQALQSCFPADAIHCLTRQALDITDYEQVSNVIANYRPRAIINTAAYTQVDKAESEKQMADEINFHGSRNLAIVCEQQKVPLLHISTDYIFSGAKLAPYEELDVPQPINHYGLSKWQGELAIKAYCEQSIVLRVSGVFSEYRQNFLKTMCQLAESRQELRIVDDQITCPTYAISIAKAIAKMINESFVPGTYHFCSSPTTSWYEFAKMIIEVYKQYRPIKVENIIAIPSSEYPTPARRPNYSALNCKKIYNTYAISQPDWHADISACIHALCRGTK